jgi:anti-sigma regulatory factor (Ser/Thr protein kinase)
MRHDRVFPNSRDAVTKARHYVTGVLTDVSRETKEAVALIVSELATNAIRHAATAFTVTVDQSSRRLRIEVTDSGGGEPHLRAPRPADPTGRGLRILDALADTWGVVSASPRKGKTVWFTLAL